MSSVLSYSKLNIAVLAPTKTILKTCPRGSNDARATIGIAATTASTTRFYNSTISRSNSNNNNSSNTNTTNDHKLLGPIVHKGYTNSKFKYFRGWAYQQVYLNRRINYKRNQKSATAEVATQEPIIAAHHDHDHNHDHDDRDRILFFEHESVYTLGRGAKESHITFLNQEEKELLSRTNRTTNASRLYVDKFVSKPIINSVASSVPPSTVSSLVEEEVNSMDEPTAVTAPNGAPIYRIERGGEVTYHGPGQLVCYPLLDLTNNPPYKQDLHWYLNCIEEVIIQTLSEYNIVGERDDINTGVWVGGNKIAAVGVSSSRWITTHGFALNITSDLEYFDTSLIIPCGIEGRGVTSIVEVLKERSSSSSEEDGSGHGNECVPHIDDVADVIIDKFQNVFNVKVEKGSILR